MLPGVGKNGYTWTRLGNRIGMGGFWFNYIYFSKARDMARFGLLVLAQGNWDGDPVMSDMDYYQQMINTSQEVNQSYGYLWWLNGKDIFYGSGATDPVYGKPGISAAPDDMFAALGKNDQKIYVVPSMGLVVIRQGDSAGGISLASSSFDNQLWKRIMNLECMPTAIEETFPNPTVQIFPNPASTYIHLKELEPGSLVRIFSADGRLLKSLQITSHEMTLPCHDWDNGLYYFQMEMRQQVSQQRVVIIQ